MIYKALSCPPTYAGRKVSGKKLTVPDQSMSLQEILRRFVRNEPLPIGREVFGSDKETDEELLNGHDAEKLGGLDLADKQELIEQQKDVQAKFERDEEHRRKEQQKKRSDAERAKLRADVEKEVRADLEKTANK